MSLQEVIPKTSRGRPILLLELLEIRDLCLQITDSCFQAFVVLSEFGLLSKHLRSDSLLSKGNQLHLFLLDLKELLDGILAPLLVFDALLLQQLVLLNYMMELQSNSLQILLQGNLILSLHETSILVVDPRIPGRRLWKLSASLLMGSSDLDSCLFLDLLELYLELLDLVVLIQGVLLVFDQLVDKALTVHLRRKLLVTLDVLDDTGHVLCLSFLVDFGGISKLRHLGQLDLLVNHIIPLPVLVSHHLLELGQFGVVLPLLDLVDEVHRILLNRRPLPLPRAALLVFVEHRVALVLPEGLVDASSTSRLLLHLLGALDFEVFVCLSDSLRCLALGLLVGSPFLLQVCGRLVLTARLISLVTWFLGDDVEIRALSESLTVLFKSFLLVHGLFIILSFHELLHIHLKAELVHILGLFALREDLLTRLRHSMHFIVDLVVIGHWFIVAPHHTDSLLILIVLLFLVHVHSELVRDQLVVLLWRHGSVLLLGRLWALLDG